MRRRRDVPSSEELDRMEAETRAIEAASRARYQALIAAHREVKP